MERPQYVKGNREGSLLPVDKAEAKKYLRVDPDYTDEDTVIDMIIAGQMSEIEQRTSLFLQVINLEIYPSSFERVIVLPFSPVQDIDDLEIKYLPPGETDFDAQSEIDPDNYTVMNGRPWPEKIIFHKNYDIPSVNTDVPRCIQIKGKFGYNTIPPGLLSYFYFLIGFQWLHREDPPAGIPTYVEKGLERWKVKYY